MDADTFREALSHWAAAVALVAVRDGDRVYGTTVSSFTPVSAEPPSVLFSCGPNAQVVPFLRAGVEIGISLLAEGQERLADDFADPFQVGPSPFPPTGSPLAGDALLGLSCRVLSLHPAPGAVRVVLAQVDELQQRGGRPLIYYRRGYRKLSEG